MTIPYLNFTCSLCLAGVQQNKSALVLGLVLVAAGFTGFAMLKHREKK